MRLRLLLAAALATASVLCATVVPTASGANECNGLPRCVVVPGPWVAVAPGGDSDYMLQCPGGKGVVGGTAALVSSQAIAVSFDGIPGSPIGIGRTTHSQVLFRAASAEAAEGFFQPYLGCIPGQGASRVTTAVTTPLGPPVELHAVAVTVVPGRQTHGVISCPAGERVAESWASLAFATASPPPDAAASITLRRFLSAGVASVRVSAPASLSAAVAAQVQLGVGCETS